MTADILRDAAGDFLNNRDDILDYVKALDDSFQAYIVSLDSEEISRSAVRFLTLAET